MLSFISYHHIIAFTSAAAASLVLSPFCRRLAIFIGAVDVPLDKRRMHSTAIPRCGGIAIYLSFFIVSIIVAPEDTSGFIIGGAIIFALGLTDDVLRLSPLTKLTFQSMAALLALKVMSLSEALSPIYVLLAFLFIVAMTNALNLIDGLDELCSGVASGAGLFLFIMSGSIYPLILTGALIGFLPYNLHPAKMFLGDTGAMLSGYLLSLFALSFLSNVHSPRPFISLAAIFALPLFDTAFSFIRRIIAGRSPLSPDRMHLHHRIVDAGISHHAASRLLILFSLALGILGISILYYPLTSLPLICLCLILSAALCIISIVKQAF